MRHALLPLILTVMIFVLVTRLLFLQIVKGQEYKSLADSNRIKRETISAPRGVIYDRNGYPLVRNMPGFRIKENGRVRVISRKEALEIQTRSESQSQELVIAIDSLREYIYPEEFAHVLGFLGEGDNQDLTIGKMGIEKKYNDILTGVPGKRLIEVEASQKELRLLGEAKPRPGQDLTTTLDLTLQKKALEALKDFDKGAVVATIPATGEVLVLFSKPTFDPNLFTIGAQRAERASSNLVYKTAEEILSSSDQPLFNRAIAGTYPPGSTFKIITAAAGLEEDKISSDTKIEDIGILRIGKFTFPNWYFIQYGKLEGFLDIVKAIKRSNDIFFYKTAEYVGLGKLEEWAKKFGVGRVLGIDIEGEEEGLFPTEEWKKNNVGDNWYLGDTYHLGIGQGYLLTTPLQVNAWTAVVANGGTLHKPKLVKNTTNKQNLPSGKSKPITQNFIKKETIGLIKEGMKQACSPGGTGWPLFKFKIPASPAGGQNSKLKIDNRNFFVPEEATVSAQFKDFIHIPVACKTGTAEFGDPQNRTHAWFTAFAPIEDPQIVVTVLVEGGGEGSNVAAPIAKEILEEWFSR